MRTILITFRQLTSTIFSYLLTPLGWLWVRYHEKSALRLGRSLNAEEKQWAKQLGIVQIDKMRILHVDRIPSPVPVWLERILRKRSFPVGNAAGMCMRYGIFILEKYKDHHSLLAHEMVHTHQFERLGGIGRFLRIYLYETMFLGYPNSPLEREANEKAKNIGLQRS